MAEHDAGADRRSLLRLFGERNEFFKSYQERRKAFSALLLDAAARRKAFEAEQEQRLSELESALSEEIGASRAALSELTLVSPEEAKDVPLHRAAYSDRMSALMAKLSLLAYVEFEDPAKKEVLEAALECAGFSLKGVFKEADTEAFIAECQDFVVLAFRGTTSQNDRKTDMRVLQRMETVPGHKRTVKVHQGFYDAFHMVGPQAHAALCETPSNKPIFLTGHSLGGALALVASAAYSGEDRLGSRIAAVYTFGAPRVGAKSFQDVVKAPHHRVVNHYDLVPNVPPSWLSGYRHTGDCLLLKHNRIKPIRTRPIGSVIGLALIGLLLWPLRRGLLFLRVHDIALYASRLDVIATDRGRWS